MARTPSQRGPFGNWLKRKREERYPTQAAALAEIRRLVGVTISPSEFAQWESGSRVPREDNPKVRALFDFFGGQPDELSLPPEADISAVVAAIDRQTAAIDRQADAISALVLRLEALAVERIESTDVVLRAIASAIGPRAPQETSSGSEPEALGGTGR